MLSLQVVLSALLVVLVLWWMWRLPQREGAFFNWAPLLALGSVWGGVAGTVLSGLLWLTSSPDRWVVVLFLVIDPFGIAAGVLTIWIYRGHGSDEQTIYLQQMQARIGITLGLIAVTIGYIYVITHKAPFTPVGQ